jgi:hypothetical protein
MKKTSNYLMVLMLIAFLTVGLGCSKQYCESGDAQSCDCSDGTIAEQVCREDGTGWETCECINNYSYWNDPATDLTWQDPQKDAYTPDDQGPGYPDAVRYCEELVLGGYDDWRLPNIDELRTLVRGNPDTEAGGDCPLEEGSYREDMYSAYCAESPQYEGPGGDGCYWADELTGPCNKEDTADDFNKPLETVSSTLAADDEFWVACILFDRGSVSFNHIYSYADVRCVREGPTTLIACVDGPPETCVPGETRPCPASNDKTGVQVCSDNGRCWGPCESTEFTLSPIEDISETCDLVNLTINVPEKLDTQMSMLVAFLFQVEGFTVPPSRPPDGGTDYNQVLFPDIDLDKPLVMPIPACSYYRDRCIPPGDYYLYVALLQSGDMPPWPQEGDYVWGYDQEPLTLQSGPRQVIDMEITLVPPQL